jgi:hypothetical protein
MRESPLGLPYHMTTPELKKASTDPNRSNRELNMSAPPLE